MYYDWLLILFYNFEIGNVSRACDYRVITAREMRVSHEAVAECFTCISSAVITR